MPDHVTYYLNLPLFLRCAGRFATPHNPMQISKGMLKGKWVVVCRVVQGHREHVAMEFCENEQKAEFMEWKLKFRIRNEISVVA